MFQELWVAAAFQNPPQRLSQFSRKNGVNNKLSAYTAVAQSMGKAREIRTVVIGAGASGLNVGRNVKEHMENVPLQICERNNVVGGFPLGFCERSGALKVVAAEASVFLMSSPTGQPGFSMPLVCITFLVVFVMLIISAGYGGHPIDRSYDYESLSHIPQWIQRYTFDYITVVEPYTHRLLLVTSGTIAASPFIIAMKK
ncbi:hypothetical protein GGR57DRAFT_502475 [Xylariaceae sp. FL1272]|nr:hypothetical protein GGR57DRAFT_502475 [Xylariaceae sp. FL1272]